MIRTIGLKLLHLVPVLFLVSLATFFMIDLVPGDPAIAIAGDDATSAQLAEIREELGLNGPVTERYFNWLGDTFTGDLGKSFLPPVQPVSDMIRNRLPVTIQLSMMAMIASFLVAVPMALRAASRAGDPFDRISNAGAFAAISVPSFLAALLLIYFFVFHKTTVQWIIASFAMLLLLSDVTRVARNAHRHATGRERSGFVGAAVARWVVGGAVAALVVLMLPDFPRQGFSRVTAEDGILENLRHAFLPALTLALTEAAIFMRLLRGDLLSTLQEDYILSARAKGMPRWRILVSDALRPSSFSLITIAGVALGRAIGGTVIVETIFNLPGMGTMVVSAIGANDYPVVQASVLVIAVFYVVINSIVDISYAYLDPRIRRGRV